MYEQRYKQLALAAEEGSAYELSRANRNKDKANLNSLMSQTRGTVKKVTEEISNPKQDEQVGLEEDLMQRYNEAFGDTQIASNDANQAFKLGIKSNQNLEGDGNTSSALTTGLDLDNLNENLLGKKGSQAGKVASQSYYNDPIAKEGFTRNAGGAPESDQLNAIEEIITVGRRLDATEEEIALALSFARYESGFNIYAAARSSSAYGLGQFIDDTGSSYGLNEGNKDDLSMQAQALIEFTQYNVGLSEKRGKGLEYVYKYHHDGPNKNSGGLSKSKEHIMPFYQKYLKLVREST